MSGSIGIIGTGPAGCFVLACLPPERLRDVHIFDDGCIGGDLAKLYGCVSANLTRTEIERALRMVPQWETVEMPILDAACAADACPKLADVCTQLRVLIRPILESVRLHTICIERAQQERDGWTLWGNDGSQHKVAKVVLCTGATAKKLDMPRPSIPLEVALCGDALAKFVGADDSVAVFGTSHSGTLILRNLKQIGCSRVCAFYKGATPFRWARNHDTEGLKQESAAIADEIVARKWGDLTPSLIRVDDLASLVRRVMECRYVIYALGFETRAPKLIGLNGQAIEISHNPDSGELAPSMWGFGIGFPSLYEKPLGGFAADIGFGGFIGHIKRNLWRL